MKAASKQRVGVTPWDLNRIAGEARLDPRTVYRVLDGSSRGSRSDNIRQQIVDAAARLGVCLPEIGDSGSGRIRAT